ncbi:MAG: MbcA/ParS/Xre antitoxin family protein [Pseudomonadota bacterium]
MASVVAELSTNDMRAGDARVLSEALARVAAFWRLSNAELGKALGLSPASASRLRARQFDVKPGTKPFELGQYLVRLFRGLDALTGSDDAAAQSWLRTDNLELGGVPLDRIQTISGLTQLTDYVDGYRGRS